MGPTVHTGGTLARAFPIAALLIAVPAALPAVSGELHFERIGSESGPPPEVITSIYQDRAGFVWVGSRDGLTMYDGYSFVEFEHDPSDPTSISDNTIRTIYEDRQGNLWLGTNTGGLNRLDRASWRFEQYRHDSSDPRSLSHDSVYAILEDRVGGLWVGTQVGLNRLDRETGTFERFLADPGDPNSISSNYVYALLEDSDGRLWASTIGGGLNVRDPVSGAFTAYRHDPDDPGTISSDSPLALAVDGSGALWVSSMAGVDRLDRREGTFRRFGQGPGEGERLDDPLVTSLVVGTSGSLWAGTHGGGLGRIDPATGAVRTWRHDPAVRHSLSSDEVIALLLDDQGALWVGTWGGGLNRLTRPSMLLSASAEAARMPADLDVDDVTALFYDRSDGLWIGTRSGDVVRRDTVRGQDRHYLRGDDRGTPRIILGFAEDSAGRIWIANNGGFVRLDPRNGDRAVIEHDPGDPASLGPGYVRGTLVDSAGRLWAGTGEGGLQQLDAAGRVTRRFRHDAADPGSLSDDYVTSILEDRHGTLWIGTRSGGLNTLDLPTGRFRRHLPDPSNEAALSHHYVTSILEDSAGCLWIGTGGGGLNRVDRGSDGQPLFTRLTEADGLIDDDVMGLLEDDDGSLWIGTKDGLTRFDPRTGSFANLFVGDGLPSGEFEAGAAARGSSTLYLGTVRGLVAVPAGTSFPPQISSPTVMTAIRTPHGELRGDRPVWELSELAVPWGEWLSLQFAVLDYSSTRRHRYAYRLRADEQWVALGSRSEVTFTGLDPGDYEFSVRGLNGQGVWSVATKPLHIAVVPPFWMTTWFRAGMVLLLVGVAVAGHRLRLNTVKRRNRELVALHEQRERAREELGHAYQRLRRLTRRLEAAKEDERRVIARELHDEMGPALTAVIINLQLMTEERDPERRSRRISETVELVDRMVDRIRDLSLDLRPPLLDELGLVPALRGYLESQAGRARLEIDVGGAESIERLPPEIEITAFRVVQEAVTNVVRHAAAKRVEVVIRHDNGALELQVRDDGRGFDVGTTMNRAASGKSLGLLGMQERVQTLNGDIRIDSTPGRGTHIRVRLPVEVPA